MGYTIPGSVLLPGCCQLTKYSMLNRMKTRRIFALNCAIVLVCFSGKSSPQRKHFLRWVELNNESILLLTGSAREYLMSYVFPFRFKLSKTSMRQKDGYRSPFSVSNIIGYINFINFLYNINDIKNMTGNRILIKKQMSDE